MADGSANRVIATAALLSVGIGTANSVFKNHELPSGRFLLGSAVAFFILSAIAEGEPEVAKALAIAVATTVVLGEGDGVLSYIAPKGEINTAKKSRPQADPRLVSYPDNHGGHVGGTPPTSSRTNASGRVATAPDHLSPYPGLAPQQ